MIEFTSNYYSPREIWEAIALRSSATQSAEIVPRYLDAAIDFVKFVRVKHLRRVRDNTHRCPDRKDRKTNN